MGLFQYSKSSLLIFGGWQREAQTSVLMMILDKNGDLSIKRLRDKSGEKGKGDLRDADVFLQNGVFSTDSKAKEVYFVGKDYIHVLNKKAHQFRTLRKITNTQTSM